MELGGVILPPELECAVFETAALMDYKNIPTLLRVAQPFHTWLQPLLYRVIVWARPGTDVSWHRMPPLWPDELAPARTAPLHVRHLVLYSMGISTTQVKNLLAVCTGVRNLVFYGFATDPSFIPYIDRIRPLMLGLNAAELFAGPPDFAHPLFTNVTHLDLWDTDSFPAYSEDSWRSLALLPCMTHLLFYLDFYLEEDVPVRHLHILLSDSKLLRALIIMWVNWDVYEEVCKNAGAKYPTNDVRFVMTLSNNFLSDWIGGAWGRADLWDRADEFIRLKRRGDISKDVYFLTVEV
ncbi:hypothetical protein C8J57DRAFT_1714911 [Mycena rebaudengoi]|nr:hypothetical protein C8J57DRAFT_1714911 [Mycena rebaudengoi]